MKKIIAFMTAAILTAGIASAAAAKPYIPFTDTDSKKVEIISRLGIINGYGDGSFKPDNYITRAEAAQIIMNTSSRKAVDDTKDDMNLLFDDYPNNLFTDLDKNHWAYAAVSVAHSNRIINGYEDGSFRPDENITEEQVIKMAVSSCGYGELAKMEGYPQGYIKRAKLLGLCENASNQPATRKFVAETAYNMLHSDIQIIIAYVMNSDGNMSPNFNVLHYGLSELNNIAQLEGTVTEAKNGKARVQIVKNYCAPEKYIGFNKETNEDVWEPVLKEGESYEMDYIYDDIAEKSGKTCYLYIEYTTDPYKFSIVCAQ